MLVRKETSPEDVDGMHHGGGHPDQHRWHDQRTRPWWPAVGASAASPAPVRFRSTRRRGKITMNGKKYGRKDTLSIDGSTGEVMHGEVVAFADPKLSGDFATLMGWADKFRTLGVAPTPTRRRTPSGRATSVLRASACAAPSTCSSRASASCRDA